MDQGTFVTIALTSFLLIHILREQKSTFHALVIRTSFCWGNSTGPSFSPRGLFLWCLSCLITLNSTPYARKIASRRNCNKTGSVTAWILTLRSAKQHKHGLNNQFLLVFPSPDHCYSYLFGYFSCIIHYLFV